MRPASRLVRRAPTRPLLWLGEPKERLVDLHLGERFPAYPAKERDLVFEPPRPPVRRERN